MHNRRKKRTNNKIIKVKQVLLKKTFERVVRFRCIFETNFAKYFGLICSLLSWSICHWQLFHPSLYRRSATWSQIWDVPNERDRCVTVTVEAITLLTPFILLIVLHFCYVFKLIIFVPTLPPSLQTLCLSLILSSVSPVVSSIPLFLRHT